jgi:hypothetical protein
MMLVTIELLEGPHGEQLVTAETMQKNIDAFERTMENKPLDGDLMTNIDTLTILEGIKRKIEEGDFTL